MWQQSLERNLNIILVFLNRSSTSGISYLLRGLMFMYTILTLEIFFSRSFCPYKKLQTSANSLPIRIYDLLSGETAINIIS